MVCSTAVLCCYYLISSWSLLFTSTKLAADSRRAIRLLGGELADVKEFVLPGTEMRRTVLVISKLTATPPAYPRKAGKPEQRPLV